jgi:hypothetical protein
LIEIKGGFTSTIEFDMGYDTKGLRAFAESGKAEDILQGFYVVDIPGPEFDVIGSLTVAPVIPPIPNISLPVPGASLKVSVDARGGIFATIGFDLADFDGNGKVYFTEIVDAVKSNPEGLFDINGRLSAELVHKLVEHNKLAARHHQDMLIQPDSLELILQLQQLIISPVRNSPPSRFYCKAVDADSGI